MTRVALVAAERSDAQLASLLDDYLRELSAHREIAVGATDAASYPYLDAYWSEPGRHAFFIEHDGEVAGFVLVRDPESTLSGTHQIAEFFIKRAARRRGIGQSAVLDVWQRFPGKWELQVHARNTGALDFWTTCIRKAATEPARVRDITSADGRRVEFVFRVP